MNCCLLLIRILLLLVRACVVCKVQIIQLTRATIHFNLLQKVPLSKVSSVVAVLFALLHFDDIFVQNATYALAIYVCFHIYVCYVFKQLHILSHSFLSPSGVLISAIVLML